MFLVGKIYLNRPKQQMTESIYVIMKMKYSSLVKIIEYNIQAETMSKLMKEL